MVLLVSDSIIAVSVCIKLHNFKVQFPTQRSVLERSMFYFVNAGIIVSLSIIVEIILFATLGPRSMIWWAFSIVTAKIHPNCYMAMLNGREFMRRKKLNDIAQAQVAQATHPSFSDVHAAEDSIELSNSSASTD
ncbi:hypothetical protein HWV62_43164 [Athelia sp. TMB]|nr:hypothetical protein HWV62_43164 [Athelia sp. TMB]